MSTVSTESIVLPFPVDHVWSVIRPLDQLWTGAVLGSRVTGGAAAAEVGSMRELTFKDDTQQIIQLTELSDDLNRLTYSLVSSTPAVSVLGASHSLQLFRVTSDNHTFLQWTSRYAAGAGQEVIEDSRWKKRDAFQKLLAALGDRRKELLDVWEKFSRTQMCQVWSALPPQAALEPEDLERLWARFDENGDGNLSEQELVPLVEAIFEFMGRHVPRRLRELVDYEDLEPEEQKETDRRLEQISAQLSAAQTKEIARELREIMDADGDGKVDKQEFVGTFQDAMARAVRKHRLGDDEQVNGDEEE